MALLLAVATAKTRLSGIDWLVIGLYFSILLGVASWVIRKAKDSAGFICQQIMFLTESRTGDRGDAGLLPYASFVAFFPHLIAGPIVRPREIMPQPTRRLRTQSMPETRALSPPSAKKQRVLLQSEKLQPPRPGARRRPRLPRRLRKQNARPMKKPSVRPS